MLNAAREPQALRTPRSAVMISDPPYPRHDSHAASFFGAMAFLLLLVMAMVAVAALGGCDADRPLTNGEIAGQVAYCKAHGLKSQALRDDARRGVIVGIQCQVSE